MNRQLAAAISLSLAGHTVLLAVIGFGFGERLDQTALNEDHRGSLSASVSLQTKAVSSSGTDRAPENCPSVSPQDGPVSQNNNTSTDAFPENELILPGKDENSGALLPSGETGRNGETVMAGSGMESPAVPVDADPSLSSPLIPVYPVMAQRAGIEGIVIIEVTIDGDGRPVDYRIQPPRSYRILEDSAVDAVMNARYSPGIRYGHTVSGSFRIKVRFELD